MAFCFYQLFFLGILFVALALSSGLTTGLSEISSYRCLGLGLCNKFEECQSACINVGLHAVYCEKGVCCCK
ncbi:hypothetical protein GLYMA_15G205700v4 [Glycine max]|uniref:Knottin scorpion toxin-like domain-containing protein n=2 Tax=Glycine subgen. Soja TaxID=1462606 RepID=K7MD16_SOYBN|nr:hypothetical protein JHK87_043005 [Glycine soja]KAG4949852.1 hypothetical protein JHK86_043091 [Glycine max]KAG4957345.1 hypothetical protein JHK85_043725 [Glycine max]KAG5117167.1 hypothetical protein JHK84_043280 [Glycine max]KAH1148104.1 hypothetical protein GYH30_042989 [Glycine max]